MSLEPMLLAWRSIGRRPEPWRPTNVQEETALRLADPLIGARTRTRIDGVAEVRTLEGGEVRQYLVWPDGTATLVESRPASLLYRRLDAARQFAGWLAAAGRVADRLSGNHFHEETLGLRRQAWWASV